MGTAAIAAPVHLPVPEYAGRAVTRRLARDGSVVVFATWGEWLPTVLTVPGLRGLLGSDWPRYRQRPHGAVRYRFAAAGLLLRFAAAAALRTEPGALDLARRPGGRPYLRGLEELEVTLTHSDELVAAGLSRVGRIGVDAEPADRRPALDAVRSRILTPAESADLDRMPAGRRTAHLLRLWTLKEAYAKAMGQGLRMDFTAFGFGPRGDSLRRRNGTAAPGCGDWAFATHRVLGRYLLSVARQDAGRGDGPGDAAGTGLDPAALAVESAPAPIAPERRAAGAAAVPEPGSTVRRAGLQAPLHRALSAAREAALTARPPTDSEEGTMDEEDSVIRPTDIPQPAPMLRLPGCDDDDPTEPNVVRGID
ncbi:4'-phosphopantetheinyl transferase family protein [Streptomyces sp. NPDC004134]|uniref:4'-phosphopantetheinyl transferase family protein n=1 Tax=Streptomyces sp. NPDC004134 TaxID=3364691 RepID=UPI00368E4DA3